jgi:hypothetical protein
MKRAVYVGMCLGFFAVTAAAQSGTGAKIGFINSRQILQQTPGYTRRNPRSTAR